MILFAGPTLPPGAAKPRGFKVLPPVAQGDVYRAVKRERAWGIGIVDGFFEHVPAVWHKEILWAMAQGIHVFGAASMGALRAAELADFGMVGVGRIFEAYRDGVLTGDDEVAVSHLSAEHDYKRVSEALVDVRATLAAAVAAGVCTTELAEHVGRHAKSIFYADRAWSRILASARTSDNVDALAALDAWLPLGRVEQKQQDGVLLVETMTAAFRSDPRPLRVSFAFQHTDIWDRALHRMDEEGSESVEPGASALLDELRLLGDEQLYTLAVQGALVRGLSRDYAARQGMHVDTELIHRTAVAFRRTHDLHASAVNNAWLDEQGLDPTSYFHMMQSEAMVRLTATVSEPEIRHNLPDQLRAMSCHGRLQSKAREKRVALQREGLRVAEVVAGNDDELWRWYFDRLGKRVPDDLAAYAERFGFEGVDAMKAAIALERWFVEKRVS
jgi:hypothetical protein